MINWFVEYFLVKQKGDNKSSASKKDMIASLKIPENFREGSKLHLKNYYIGPENNYTSEVKVF